MVIEISANIIKEVDDGPLLMISPRQLLLIFATSTAILAKA